MLQNDVIGEHNDAVYVGDRGELVRAHSDQSAAHHTAQHHVVGGRQSGKFTTELLFMTSFRTVRCFEKL